MAEIIGVRFKDVGKIYYFDPSGLKIQKGSHVVVETARGTECGTVMIGNSEVDDSQVVLPLKPVVRLATDEDLAAVERNRAKQKEAFKICQEKIAKHKLDMKLVSVEYTFDNSKIIFYFTANGRVDFRELVKDLAGVFKMRIELRQIGVRDEAKMLGGLGACGRPICCGAFLGDFQPVSIKMAKEQNLSLNPTKISGQCGRLMCCLKYEQDYYEATLKKLPKVGKDIMTPDGAGVVTEINPIREKVKVRIHTADDTFDLREYAMDDVRRMGPDDAAAIRETVVKPDRRPKKAEPEAEQPQEEPKKRRYPHQKAVKNLSTDQFLEKIGADAEQPQETAGQSQRPAQEERQDRRPRRRPRPPRREDRERPEKAPAPKNEPAE